MDQDPDPPPGAPDPGRARDTVKVQAGLKWTALSMVLFRFARLGTTIVLARILTREDFGLVTMAMAFILAFQALRDVGFGPAFVQRKDLGEAEERVFASTMFWVVLGVSGAMFAVAWLLAPFAAGFFPELPGLAPILRGVFVLLLIEGVSMTPTAVLQKRLEFGLIARGEAVGIVLHAALSILFAVLGFGPWSIILGTLGSRGAQTAYVLRLARWRPARVFDRAAARELFGFGRYLWGNSLLGASSKIVDKMTVGRLLDDATLGVYGNAYNLCTTASKPIYSIILRVTFPALSRIQDDRPAMRRAVLAALGNVALVTVPLSVGLAAVAEDFVVVVYGETWRPMAPLVRVLASYGIVMSLASITAPVLMALGRVRRMFHFALLGQLLMVALFVALGRHGAMGIAAGLVIATTTAEVAAFVYAARALELPLAEAAAPVVRVAVAALVMAAVVLGTAGLLAAAPEWLRLAVTVAVGVGAYLGAQVTFNRAQFRESVAGLRGVLAAR